MLIVFEGLDGCGKDTQINLLKNNLESIGLKVGIISNILEGTPLGNHIRNVLDPFSGGYRNNLHIAELFLAELHNVNYKIKKMLSEYNVIICSRWWFSTLAYAGYKSEKDFNAIHSMCNYEFTPDITFYLSIDATESVKRIGNRKGKPEIYDNVEKQTAIKVVYDTIARNELQNFPKLTVINGMDSMRNISNVIELETIKVLNSRNITYNKRVLEGFAIPVINIPNVRNKLVLNDFFKDHKVPFKKMEEIIRRITGYAKDGDTYNFVDFVKVDNNTLIISIEKNKQIISIAKIIYYPHNLSKPIRLVREKVGVSLLSFISNLKRFES